MMVAQRIRAVKMAPKTMELIVKKDFVIGVKLKEIFDEEFMTAKELIKQIQDNLELDAELDFLIFDHRNNKNDIFWGNIIDICMNVDVDDPNNYHRGGIIFETRNIKN